MNIQMTGIDHTLAALDLREKFSFTTKVQLEILEELRRDPGVLGAVMLSTCNRTELWAHCREGFSADLRGAICARVPLQAQSACPRMVSRTGEDAVRYLLRMTAGLQSQIFGEDQILTQVKEAASRAREGQCTDTVMEVLFRMAVTGAKKAKTAMQTSMADTGAVGLSMARLRAEGYDFRGKTALVIGNGKMGKLAAQALREAGADVTVTVRQYRSGVVEIPAGCKRVDYGERAALFPGCDLIVSATTSPNVTVRRAQLDGGYRLGLVLIDLAVPRDVEPEVASLPGLHLYDIDSFQAPQSAELAQLQATAEEILEAQAQEFFTWYDCRDMIPMVGALAQQYSTDLIERVNASLRGHGVDLSQLGGAYLQEAILLATQKQFRQLVFSVRDEAGADTFRACLGAVEKLYES